jgi:GR25 family glycosyltransferase involved in LPS biosynthesis
MQPKTFIIVLDTEEYYTKLVEKNITDAKSLNWNIEIFPAINGTTITDKTWKDHGIYWSYHRALDNKPGVYGCFLSHWMLWNKCIELNKPIIILEHDIKIHSEWRDINLYYVEVLKLYPRESARHLTDTVSGKWSIGAHAYYITPIAAKKIINFVKNNGAFAVDILLGDKVVDVRYDPSFRVRRCHTSNSSTDAIPYSFDQTKNCIYIPKFNLEN